MKRIIMSYMVATIVSLAAVIGLAIQPSILMAQVQNSTAATPPAATSPAATSPAATSPAAAVTNPACGEVVQGNVNLTANLKCSGDGIIVGADSTNINLNGYSIIGPGQQSSKVGVVIPNNNN